MGWWTRIASASLLAGLSTAVFASEAETIAAQVAGVWKNPAGGSCEAAYFKSTDLTKTVRGEAAVGATVSNAGMVVPGQLILAGAREGQIVNPMNDKAIFLVEPQPGDKLHFIPIGEPALAWPEVTLELCPGSRR
jgi:hypothetical protein